MFDRSRCEPRKLIVASLRAMVRDFDASRISCEDAAAQVDWFAEVERLAAAGKTMAAARAAEGDAWRRDGSRSPADWLAKRTGSTVGDARGVLKTAESLPDAPGTDAALRAGSLSAKQAEAIAPAAAADPSSEARLLELARRKSLGEVRDEAARVIAAAEPDPAARHERIRKERAFRCFNRADGSRAATLSGTPEEVALFERAAQPFIDQRLDAARAAGERESSEAYAFDGVVEMAKSTMDPDGGNAAAAEARTARGGRGRKRFRDRRELLGIINLETLRRGKVAAGELCEIAGVGSVPVETMCELFGGDTLLRIVIRDGVDIRTVVHGGRVANALQETAVFARQDGRCGVSGCGLGIAEIDHVVDWVKSRRTTLDELVGLCATHHDLKSRHGHRYTFDPDTGEVTWIAPDGEGHERPPP